MRSFDQNVTSMFSLPADQQIALVEECRAMGQETSEKIAEMNDEIKGDLQKKGMEIVTDIDLAAFRNADQKAYEVLGISDAKKAIEVEMGK